MNTKKTKCNIFLSQHHTSNFLPAGFLIINETCIVFLYPYTSYISSLFLAMHDIHSCTLTYAATTIQVCLPLPSTPPMLADSFSESPPTILETSVLYLEIPLVSLLQPLLSSTPLSTSLFSFSIIYPAPTNQILCPILSFLLGWTRDLHNLTSTEQQASCIMDSTNTVLLATLTFSPASSADAMLASYTADTIGQIVAYNQIPCGSTIIALSPAKRSVFSAAEVEQLQCSSQPVITQHYKINIAHVSSHFV